MHGIQEAVGRAASAQQHEGQVECFGTPLEGLGVTYAAATVRNGTSAARSARGPHDTAPAGTAPPHQSG
ncbi:hypothetical protein NMD1_01129 [Novosphingobium sp. MD-1]|nr:hypothetical protein NMD1_01129 [Novosphingobium sp. MD-1]